jgi:homoserine trans-succinylase
MRRSDSSCIYRGADKSLARPTSRCTLFDGENISFDASLVIYINSTNIPPIIIINKKLKIFCRCSLFPFLVGLRTYQHPVIEIRYNIKI